jgi:hypothetical protein
MLFGSCEGSTLIHLESFFFFFVSVVEFSSEKDAQMALKTLNGEVLRGKPISLRLVRTTLFFTSGLPVCGEKTKKKSPTISHQPSFFFLDAV